METEFDTVNKQMIHDFKDGSKVVTDLRLNTTYVLDRKGDLIEKFSINNMLLTDYTEWVMNIETTMK